MVLISSNNVPENVRRFTPKNDINTKMTRKKMSAFLPLKILSFDTGVGEVLNVLVAVSIGLCLERDVL